VISEARDSCSPQARLEMLAGISTLLAALPGVFDTEDMRGVFSWLDKFVRNPWSNDDSNVYGGEIWLLQILFPCSAAHASPMAHHCMQCAVL